MNNDMQTAMADLVASQFYQGSMRKLPSGILPAMIRALEKPLIESVLKAVRGNQVRASEVLGMNRNTLHNRCKKYNILPCDYYVDSTRHYRQSIEA